MNANQEHTMWIEIIQRLEAGEMQSEVARAYGMSRGKFRYRLQKFMETAGMAEIAVTSQEIQFQEQEPSIETKIESTPVSTPTPAPTFATEAAPVTKPAPAQVALKLDTPLVDPSLRDASLVDETWNRSHGLNRLVAMVKEPRTLFAYWEVNEQRKHLIQEHFRADWNVLPFCLIVHDVTDLLFTGTNANDKIRIDVNPRAESWYIHGIAPGRRYQIDLCTQTITGQLFTILRSNIVETPPLPQENQAKPHLKFSTIHQETPDFLRAKDAELAPSSLANEPWHDKFTGYNLSESKASGEGDKL
ncbi:DUF4912 domain-containing protein [Tumebacillus sp. ITR2]|uniref:DUF4912 domain-containing protein n=1 Tax=Tumebacillus amylolyticus TaxID=2801339 RepID=A0ABS1J7F6_9BACL|nr:DUF4912 domain-containing protein [Tumebacillus amylolyticus]MBL0386208.1 DUF4912 domain-containing protein [Tumebacillus amylolyticus]